MSGTPHHFSHFPHSVREEYNSITGKQEPVDGSFCGDSGPLTRPFPPPEIEPEWCPKCLRIWAQTRKEPWRRVCRCLFIAQDEICTKDCWVHGTSEGRQWERGQGEARYRKLEKETRQRLTEAQGALSVWAKAAKAKDSQAIHRMEESIMWFEREAAERRG